jgi:hypothetical protein
VRLRRTRQHQGASDDRERLEGPGSGLRAQAPGPRGLRARADHIVASAASPSSSYANSLPRCGGLRAPVTIPCDSLAHQRRPGAYLALPPASVFVWELSRRPGRLGAPVGSLTIWRVRIADNLERHDDRPGAALALTGPAPPSRRRPASNFAYELASPPMGAPWGGHRARRGPGCTILLRTVGGWAVRMDRGATVIVVRRPIRVRQGAYDRGGAAGQRRTGRTTAERATALACGEGGLWNNGGPGAGSVASAGA